MCLGCAEIYGTEYAILREWRQGTEAIRLPNTQEEWNAMYPRFQAVVAKHLKEAKEGWDEMLEEEGKG